ncbi:nitrogenase-stabilizing/protective protein NifW [Sulfurospirillum arcachonense]|uniref:nitrogenase-stabilizing/protective protein NifW n=1 Tax=Sulfurospirillum arcachonense TaxID=57666 RepID=UPI0004699A80|nr:nitrogenase-stabilizing/protective protein NifW [Sulfurospirillum arcachonense]
MNSKEQLNDFYKLSDAEDYFDFFKLEYDEKLVNVKRFHILREYGNLIKTGLENLKDQEDKLLDFLKFSLLQVYGNFKNGYAPSAAEVWNMFKDGKATGCLGCIPSPGNSCGC